MLSVGALFAGLGGLELGLEWAGLGPVLWQVENDPYCIEILEKHWPDVKRYTDVKSVGCEQLERVDILAGGFPCQDVSVAGSAAGLDGDRSGLWYEMLRIITELKPPVVIIENVASGGDRWVDGCRGGLAQQGYASLPVPLAASDCGAPHKRRRIFLVATTTSLGALRVLRESILSRSQETCLRVPVSGVGLLADDVADPLLAGLEGGAGDARHRVPDQVDVVAGPHRWRPEPETGRVDDGTPRRVDRLTGLGNAVVPACGQVVGWVARELIELLGDDD